MSVLDARPRRGKKGQDEEEDAVIEEDEEEEDEEDYGTSLSLPLSTLALFFPPFSPYLLPLAPSRSTLSPLFPSLDLALSRPPLLLALRLAFAFPAEHILTLAPRLARSSPRGHQAPARRGDRRQEGAQGGRQGRARRAPRREEGHQGGLQLRGQAAEAHRGQEGRRRRVGRHPQRAGGRQEARVRRARRAGSPCLSFNRVLSLRRPVVVPAGTRARSLSLRLSRFPCRSSRGKQGAVHCKLALLLLDLLDLEHEQAEGGIPACVAESDLEFRGREGREGTHKRPTG